VPAPYEQGVRRAHRTSITRSCAACPSGPRHRGRRTRGRLVWHHVPANVCIRRAYSAPLENTKNVTGSRCPGLRGLGRPPGLMVLLSAGQRRSALLSAGQRRSALLSAGQRRSALADPGHRRLGPLSLTGRKVLAITPGAAGAVVVMALPAWNADHRIPPVRKPRRSGWGGAPGTARWIGARRTAAGLAVAARVSLLGYVTSAMIREPLRAGDTPSRRCHVQGAAIPREPSGCRPLAMLGPVTSSRESSPFTAMEDVKRLSSRYLCSQAGRSPRRGPVLEPVGKGDVAVERAASYRCGYC